MEELLVFLSLISLVSGISSESYIVGGGNVDIQNHPWQGSYRNNLGSHACGCVFVGGFSTLTAGHCGGSSAFTVAYGYSKRSQHTPIAVTSVSRHPQFGQGSGYNPYDFAVVVTNTIPSGIGPANIARSAANPGGNGWITGWGRTCGSCSLPDHLQGVNIPIISDAECASKWGASFNSAVMMCVYNGKQGACNGDSGGPLAFGSTIYGLTSWGPSGCSPSYPSAYAKVGAVRNWICSETSNTAQGCL